MNPPLHDKINNISYTRSLKDRGLFPLVRCFCCFSIQLHFSSASRRSSKRARSSSQSQADFWLSKVFQVLSNLNDPTFTSTSSICCCKSEEGKCLSPQVRELGDSSSGSLFVVKSFCNLRVEVLASRQKWSRSYRFLSIWRMMVLRHVAGVFFAQPLSWTLLNYPAL